MEHNRVICTRPYDAEVEYLKSNGNQYLDIGIIPKTKYRAICEYMPEKNSKEVMALFGQRTNGNSSNMFDVFMAFGTNCKYCAQYAENKSVQYIDNIPNILHTIELGEKSYLDGNLLKTATTTFNGAYTISIFAIHQNYSGSVNYNDRRMKDCRVYSFKLYNGSDTLIFDGIPVRRGTKGYMYDRVSKKLFENEGTGNFILGNDVVNPVPNIRRVFRFDNKRFVMPMPYDSKIEYLESTGTQWIDTDTIVNSLDSISVTLQFTQVSQSCIWSARNVNPVTNSFTLFKLDNLRFDYGQTPVSKNIAISNYLIKHEYKAVANKLYVDDVLKATNTAASFTAGKSVMVLASLSSSNKLVTINFAYAKLYSVKIINSNNEILRDLIPVCKNGIGYMFDKVSGKLFGNSGTGQFILGNDIN